MKITDLHEYLPQKTFLMQGTVETYSALLDSTLSLYPLAYTLSVSRFTVEHARTLVTFILEGDGTDRIYLVYFTMFSPDAAEVLLKALEEPDIHTTIVFITPYPYLISQTIRSRVALIHTNARLTEDLPVDSKAAALSYIQKEFDSETDDAATRRAKAVSFLDALELKVKTNRAQVETLYRAKEMLFRANMPTKYVLEYAVTLIL